jgi:Sulfotransferase family
LGLTGQNSGVTSPDLSLTAHRPILIVGSNGSGSTLLRLMLNSHEHIAIPGETGFLRLAMTHEWVPYWALGGQWASQLGLSADQLDRALANFYGGMFAAHAATQGKQRWGDKTPFHVWHLQRAARLFPDVQIIGIIRHPAAVAASLRRRFRRPIPHAITHWNRTTRQLIQGAIELGDRCVLLRYEDLVAEPRLTMTPLLEWLDEPWSEQVLAHHRQQDGVGTDAEGFTRTDTPINPDQASSWERELTVSARQLVADRSGAIARFLGYDPARAAPVEPLTASGPLLTGTGLHTRQLTRPNEVDWDAVSLPTLADLPLRPPIPRRRRASRNNLDEITMGDLIRHKTIGMTHQLPDSMRERGNALRRAWPSLDRWIGPR